MNFIKSFSSSWSLINVCQYTQKSYQVKVKQFSSSSLGFANRTVTLYIIQMTQFNVNDKIKKESSEMKESKKKFCYSPLNVFDDHKRQQKNRQKYNKYLYTHTQKVPYWKMSHMVSWSYSIKIFFFTIYLSITYCFC